MPVVSPSSLRGAPATRQSRISWIAALAATLRARLAAKRNDVTELATHPSRQLKEWLERSFSWLPSRFTGTIK